MTDPAIARLAEFTKRLGERGSFVDGFDAYRSHQAFDKAVAALHADLTHVLAELEGARKALEPFALYARLNDLHERDDPSCTIDVPIRDLLRAAAQLSRDEEPK